MVNKAAVNSKWDAIVIGAGVGGLTLAAMMAKLMRKKVLVIERHAKLGGFTHTFKRRANYEFDIGVHYVGELQAGSRLRATLDFLTDRRLAWQALPHDYDRLIFPDFTWSIPSSRAEHLARLKVRFPSETQALEQYFKDERKIAEAYGLWQFAEKYASPLRRTIRGSLRVLRRQMFATTSDVLNSRFSDPQLKAILGARWMGFGTPPDQSSFGMTAVHGLHYGHGAWYPTEGGQSIATQLAATIESCGGEILTRTDVRRILTDNHRAVGVEISGSDSSAASHFYSDLVISNVGARKTYLGLIDDPSLIPFHKKLTESEGGTSVLSLFMGLDVSPRALGFEGANYWFCSMEPPQILSRKTLRTAPLWCFFSFPSLKSGSSFHTAQVIVMCSDDLFTDWQGTRWRRRPDEYESFKTELSEIIFQEIEARYPGFREHVEFYELSTPLSVQHFHASPRGAVYGVPSVPERFSMPWCEAQSPVSGLYLTGSDAFCPGISGAIHGALKTYDVMSGEKFDHAP